MADDTDALVRDAVRMFRGLASGHVDLDDDDLFQECRLHVEVQRGSFRYGKWSTWVYSVVRNRIIDLGRMHGRRKTRDVKYAESSGREYADAGEDEQHRVPIVHPVEVIDEPSTPPETTRQAVGDTAPGPSLCEWLHGVYVVAKRACVEPRHTQGRRHFTAAQQYAVGLLYHRLGRSLRDVVAMLEERPDLRRAIEMDRVPSVNWMLRAKVVTEKIHAAQAPPAGQTER